MNKSKNAVLFLTSILLALVFIFTPFGMLFASEGVDTTVSTSWGSVNVGSITNNSDKRVVGWTITIKGVPAGASLQGQGWNANFSLQGDTLTVKSSADWNSTVEPHGSTDTQAGCYLDGITGEWTPTSVSIKPKFEEVAPGGNDPAPTATPTPEPTATPVPTATPEQTTTPVPTATPAPTAPTTDTTPSETTASSETTFGPMEWIVEPATGDDWLTTDGNRIVDMNGTEVWLTGINWFGYNTGTNIFDGCWNCNMENAIQAIANHGFNLLRIPISAELVLNWRNGIYPEANFNQASNPELVGKNSQQIFDYALSLCSKYGLKVMLDIHSANTDAAGHNANLWYTEKISSSDYYDAIAYLADRYKDNDTVIAYDLKNEPHGKPGEEKAIWNDSESENNWKYVAQKAGNIVLDANPHALIVIEGTEIYPKDIATNGDYSSVESNDYYFNWWGANLRGVKDYPIDFGSEERNRQIVYSPHDYGPAVFQQPWFQGEYTYESLKEDCWNDNWLYIHEENIAPILIGEWGGFMTEPNLTWMTDLRQLIGEQHLHFTFWCFNANSGDTGGLVLDDFTTWDEEKYAFVSQVLWQDEGKFVSLDHVVPLGDYGKSLSEYSGEILKPEPTIPETSATASSTTVPAQTSAPSETPAPTAAPVAAGTAKKSNSFGKILKYVLWILLVLILGGGVFLFFKKPRRWNQGIDKCHLPKGLKRVIPADIWSENVENKRFRFDDETISKNNEFAGRFRPVARPNANPSKQADVRKPDEPDEKQ